MVLGDSAKGEALLSRALFVALLAAATASALPSNLGAQVPSGQQVPLEAGGFQIEGPPPPAAPAVITQDDEGRSTIRAFRVDGMNTDGVLEEPFYQTTASIDAFIQSTPNAGAEPSERTEAWISFDDENVYISARIWYSLPEDEWVANEL